MNTEDVLAVFREAGAILEGHFILTSGLRSPVFLQKARVFMHADKTEKLCKALAEKIQAADLGPIDYVVGPAIGGLIPSYETSRHLRVPSVWVERENGVFRLRRFDVPKGARVVIVEDIVTTGLSIRETIDCMKDLGIEVVAAACIVDRSAGKADVGTKLIALAEYEVPAYPADKLPPELAAIPAVKPGSRNI
ncbi:orotate phosphoribosyltransferase [Brucella anthropi]|uniref:Orotate phosphoribosyltransferase n=1 Tax=Brucella anthropi (strain ATCC 49188 / DSM 6882 / CCUG 24695 / JCM 21032 / LMG 3331 / NBRC 15819 / NCTC 12168 / Alc 37) TaxID=439375 RepID=PYRE_BRUA4|nr:orotate phosphoribosyltransferase [Brucella anthropi]A6X294.1 RecName: Full=Orotate phosphoribosyltransferase; Short=OPRT; Short=OPRTase [Brucella anthropi ATCC 49188]MCR5940395.1 orotate phosphoribosyltransferase [Ochrobactrum sp. XJ1]ABS15348.1 orotate phosphoribosyltransferase [Brucella anthropi ATCC 49188]AIK43103.1 orotate phosphoribosyltransferase [Brucella anthropi]KAB2748567.1 orotate phosphoribosyltransferase [Brucella anthropi]KAB2777186.1 orotate phosphoribosyltransferase [Bruce